MQSSALSFLDSHLASISPLPNEVRRLFHGRGKAFEGLEQLTIDWLDGQILISIFKEVNEDFLSVLKQHIASWLQIDAWKTQVKSVLLQYRFRMNSPIEVIFGELTERQNVVENKLKFQLDLGQKQNNGLFLDMRYGRKWVLENSQNKRVLNLFSYTCGFSVAAVAGGAQSVVNLDMAKAALSKGRVNHQLNEHDLRQVRFLGYDLFKSWGKVKKFGPYDLIIIDPPSFQKGSFALTKDYKKILRRLHELLSEDGQVLACVNDPDLTSQFLIDEMAEHAPSMRYLRRLENPPEFIDSDPEASLKSLLFVFDGNPGDVEVLS